MSKYRSIVVSFMLLFCNSFFTQTNVRLFSSAFQTIPPHAKIVVLGENHIRKNFIQKCDAIWYFCEVRGFRSVFLEEGSGYQVMMQNFVSGVNNEITTTEYWRKPDKYIREDIALLEQIRLINKTKPLDAHVKVRCYDLFDYAYMQDLRAGILSLFPDTSQITSMHWFSVLNDDGYIKICDRYEIWSNLKAIRDCSSADEFAMSNEQWHQFLKCISNLETACYLYSFDYQSQIRAWNQREDQLFENIFNYQELLSGSIIFCGSDHAELTNGLANFNINKPPFTARLKAVFKESVCTILPHYANLGLVARKYDPEISCFIEYGFADSLLNKNDYLRMIASVNLPTQAPGRGKCDYLLIINSRKANKVYRRHKYYNLPHLNAPFSEWYSIRAILEYYHDPDAWSFDPDCDL